MVSASFKDIVPKTKGKKPSGPLTQRARGKKLTKTDMAREIGKLLGQRALKKKIKKVVFDRGGYKYHGRVKAVAEGARKEGLQL